MIFEYSELGYGPSRAPVGKFELGPPLRSLWSYPEVSAFRVSEKHVVAITFPDGLICLDLGGVQRWKIRGKYFRPVLRLGEVICIADDDCKLVRVNVETGVQKILPFNRSLVAVAEDGQTGVTFAYTSDARLAESRIGRSLLRERTAVLWERLDRGRVEVGTAYQSNVALSAGRVFVAKEPARLLCLDYSTGETLWDADLEDARPGLWQPGIAHLEVRGYPMVSNGRVLVVTGIGLAAFDVTTGRLLWSHHVHAGSASAPYGNRVYVITGMNFSGYRIIDMETGDATLDRELTDEKGVSFKEKGVALISGLGVTETHIFAGDNHGRLWALERDTGRAVWSHRPKTATSYASAIPVICGGRLYIAGFSLGPKHPQHLYCYEPV